MKASFVIVNYNRKNELLQTISKTEELVKGNRADYEIVVVDNASSDGSASAVKSDFPDVVLIERKVNIGAPAWNDGFAKAKGEYFIILDDDSHIESGLEEAIEFMDRHQDVGILALNVITGPYTCEMWNWKDGQQTVGFIGCGAIFRRKTYEKIGGYADWMFLYVNEWELGLRCIDAGYQVRFFAGCRVDHRASRSHRSSKRLHILVTRHELGIVYKYFPRERRKHLLNVGINSLKLWRYRSLIGIWYNMLGIISFLKLRKTLTYSPVSIESQKIFSENFYSVSPAFGFIKRGFKLLRERF